MENTQVNKTADFNSNHKEDFPPSFPLSRVLRYLGTVTLLVAAGTFLFQRWDELSHVYRYLSFLGFTFTLTASGFLTGSRIGDTKGARTFLGIVIALAPVHFCVLGALIYSCFGSELLGTKYPVFLHWTAGSCSEALMLTGLGLMTLLPMLWTSFRAFTREHAAALSIFYISTNTLLLVPLREPTPVGFISLGLLVAIFLVERFAFSRETILRTSEGRLVRTMLYLPYIVLVIRTLTLYQVSDVFVAMLFAAAAFVIYKAIPEMLKERATAISVQALSLFPAAISWAIIYKTIYRPYLLAAESFRLPTLLLPFATLTFIMGHYSLGTGQKYKKLAVGLASAAFVLNVFYATNIYTALLALLFGLSLVFYGYQAKLRTTAGLGLLSFVVGLSYYFIEAVQLAALSPWLSLGLVGILIIVASSLVEKHYDKLNGLRPWGCRDLS